mgnify:CR=1 FL=1
MKITKYLIILIYLILISVSKGNNYRLDNYDISKISENQKANIYTLDIDNKVVDIKKLKEFKNLRNLSIKNSKILNFNELNGNKKLLVISLEDSVVIESDNNIEWNLENLRELVLINIKGIDNLNIIKNSKKIETIIVRNLGLENIEIADSSNLTYVDLRENKLKNINFLKNNKIIEILLLDKNKIEEIDVKNFLKLKILSIKENNLRKRILNTNKLHVFQ